MTAYIKSLYGDVIAEYKNSNIIIDKAKRVPIAHIRIFDDGLMQVLFADNTYGEVRFARSEYCRNWAHRLYPDIPIYEVHDGYL